MSESKDDIAFKFEGLCMNTFPDAQKDANSVNKQAAKNNKMDEEIDKEKNAEGDKEEDVESVKKNTTVQLKAKKNIDTNAQKTQNKCVKSCQASNERSRRLIKAPQKFVFDPYNVHWSNDEKQKLLDAMYEYGHLDIAQLHEKVQTKSMKQIKDFIDFWLRKASRTDKYERLKFIDPIIKEEEKAAKRKKRTNEPCTSEPTDKPKKRIPCIDTWIKGIHSRLPPEYDTSHIAKAFRYFALFGDHPPPDKCYGVDFECLYNNLSRLLQGNTLLQMNVPTGYFFHMSVQKLLRMYFKLNLNNEEMLTSEKYKLNEADEDATKRDKKHVFFLQDEEELGFLSQMNYNPLQLNGKALEVKRLGLKVGIKVLKKRPISRRRRLKRRKQMLLKHRGLI